jgi:transposase
VIQLLFVGIDVASRKHDATITTYGQKILSKPFTIQNNMDGYKKLRDEILSHTEHLDDVHIGIEETGIYSKNISEFLALCGFTVHMINPILTSHSRKSDSVRITKTDRIDALAISKYVEYNYKRLDSYTPSLYTNEELKSLSRARLDIQNKLIKAKVEWTRLLDITFPEFRLKYNQHSSWVYELFSKYPTPDKISKMHSDTLIKLIGIHGDRDSAAIHIKSIAKNTVGNTSKTNKILIESILDDIMHFEKQMKRFESEIEFLVKERYSNILTIPGVGPILAGIIIGEIGNIVRFHSPSELLAYAGIDPTVYESGLFKSKQVKISKRGSKYLRSAIYTATKVACINPKIKENKFKLKYKKKLNAGKHHNSAIFNVAKNMIYVIYKLLITGENFRYDI